MQNWPQCAEYTGGLDEILEIHIGKLSEKLSQPYALDEIEAELAALLDFLYTYRRRDELLEKLLDGSTAEDKRRQIREALKAQSITVVENRSEMERVHARSHELLERSAQFILKAQRLINKGAHTHSGYALELCGLCKGVGLAADTPCRGCNGKGSVLVHQPSLKCPRCAGNGMPAATDELTYHSLCAVCRGSGWVMTTE